MLNKANFPLRLRLARQSGPQQEPCPRVLVGTVTPINLRQIGLGHVRVADGGRPRDADRRRGAAVFGKPQIE